MNWRLFTAINAIIALVTIGAVVFDLTRPRAEQSSNQRRETTFQSNAADDQAGKPADTNRIESVDDLANARVDDLGAVPAVELTELMERATPAQLAEMALKFNDAPTDARTFAGMGIFFQAWAQLDPMAALVGAFRINDVAMRKLAAQTVVGSVSPSATPELIAFLTEHPDEDLVSECKNEFLGNLISNWSQVDPEAASRFVDEMADTKNDRRYDLAYGTKSTIAYNWATLDPSAALEWAAKQKGKNSVYGSDLYDSVIRGWCRRDISTASAYVAQHLNDQDAGTSASSVVTALFDHNIEDATSWVSSMPAGDPRDQAESRIASLWAAKDPSSAAKWVATLPANEQTNAVSTIAMNWVDTNWPDASRWIATLTGDARDQALRAAVYRDGATPSDSLSLALSIGKDEVRNDVVENVIRTWAATDANAAETWVKGSPLSSEHRDQLRSVIAETQKAAEGERVIIVH
jgi:hypothetical protein